MTVKPFKQPDGRLLDSLREGFAFVAAGASHVRLREDRLASYADSLPSYEPFNTFDTQRHFIGNAEETAAYVLTLDSINFGSGYKPLMAAEGFDLVDGSIYYTLSTRLKDHFEAHGALTPCALNAMTPAIIGKILRLPMEGHYSREFAGLCAQAMNITGRQVDGGRGRTFTGYIRTANGSAEKLVESLVRLDPFCDTHPYKGRDVSFHKRAQITAADLQLAFRSLGQELFHDTHRLTMFADNAVPHVLHVDGILEYEPALAARIAAGQHIASGSEEEIEIRACAAHAVERIAALKKMPSMTVDHILWHRSVEDGRYKQAPSHKTLSWFY